MNDFFDGPCERNGRPPWLRCRPGDVAIIVGHAYHPCGRACFDMDRWKIGRIVRVIAPAPWSHPCAPLWWIEPIYSPDGACMRREADHSLLPLFGLPDETERAHARTGIVLRFVPEALLIQPAPCGHRRGVSA